MSTFAERMRAIADADAERRRERETAELAALAGIAYPVLDSPEYDRNAMVIRADARAMGAVTALTCSASPNSWDALGRVIGYAPGAPITPRGTYRRTNLYDPSVSSVESVGSRGERRTSPTRATSSESHAADYEARGALLGYNSELASE